MQYKIIATGSKGNAVVLNNNILIDCGVSFKALNDVYKDLQIILLTHIHKDHFNPTAITNLAKSRPTLRFGCCDWLVPALVACDVSKRNIDVYNVGKLYNYGQFKISPVKLYHNVPQCGYRVFVGDKKALYCTDTGTLEGITARNYNLYLIEANYGEDEIQERIKKKQSRNEYCYELGVLNRHLSKEQADSFLLENMGENSRYVYLHAHVDKTQEVKNE